MTQRQLNEDEHRLGRYDDRPMRRVLTRIGWVGGRQVQTFHCALGAVQVAMNIAGWREDGRGLAKALDGLAYIDRAGTYGDQAHALLATGGTDRKDIADALEAVDDAAIWRKGRTAEKVALTLVVELSKSSTTEQLIAAAERTAEVFGEGGPVGWAIHRPPSDNGNWHLHLIRPARRVERSASRWVVVVDETGQRIPPAFRKPHQKKALRAAVATAINETCQPEIEYHPGRLRDIGVDRAGKKRLPQWAYLAIQGCDERLAQVEIKLQAPSPHQRDQALYVLHWNAAIDRGEDPEQDPFVKARLAALAEEARIKAEARKAAAEMQAKYALKRTLNNLEHGHGLVSGKIAGAVCNALADTIDELKAKVDDQENLVQRLEDERTRTDRALSQADQWRTMVGKLEGMINAEQLREDQKPPTDKQLTSCRERAERLGVELPEGWDSTIGSAGVAMRLLATLEARQKAADERLTAVWQRGVAAELEALQSPPEPPPVREVVKVVERVPEAIQRELEALRRRPDPADLQRLAALIQAQRKTPNGAGAWDADWVKQALRAMQLQGQPRGKGRIGS